MSKRALIIGVTGQDGAYLSKLLLEKGYTIYGTFRGTSQPDTWRLRYLGIDDAIRIMPLNLLELGNICRTLEEVKPDEIYNFAAQSSVALSFEQAIYTSEVTGVGALRVLEAVRDINSRIRFYQASTSEMFGNSRETPINESSSFYPKSPYAISKLFAHLATVNYREAYGLFACSGILFNHESPLRGLEFVTRKITHTIAGIKHGKQRELMLGNLDVRRDWGYAPEYVEAMWLMLQQSEPDDYVIATGENHSIREFVDAAFGAVGIEMEWSGNGADMKGIDKVAGKTLVAVDPRLFRPADIKANVGDYSKAKEKLGWSPRTSFKELVALMVDSDLRFLRQNDQDV